MEKISTIEGAIQETESQTTPKKKPVNITNANAKLDIFIKFAFNIGLILISIGFVIFAVYEYQKDNLVFEAFEVPQALHNKGYTGTVVANQIIDKISTIKLAANSFKQDGSSISNSATVPDIDFKVVGVGLSVQTTIEYLKIILGKPSKTISGEITMLDSTLTLHLRITGEPPISFEKSLKNSTEQASLDTLFTQVGANVLKMSEPYLLMAYMQKLNMSEEAISLANYIVNTPPSQDDVWAYGLWGGILMKQKDSLGAVQMFQKAISLEPKMPTIYSNWAILHNTRGNYEEAIKMYQKALETEPNYLYPYVGLAIVYRKQQKYEQAIQSLQEVLKINPNYKDAYSGWANLLRDQKKYKEAIEKYKYALLIDPSQSIVYNNLAFTYYLDKQYELGLESIKKAIRLSPKDGVLYSTLAELSDALGDEEGFYKSVELAIINKWNYERALKNEPYVKYKDKPRFKEILEKYK